MLCLEVVPLDEKGDSFFYFSSYIPRHVCGHLKTFCLLSGQLCRQKESENKGYCDLFDRFLGN